MEASVNSHDDVKKDDDDVFVEDATSTDSTSPQRKNRSNSVIDSIGISGESSPRANVSPRSKSAPTMDTSFDEGRYSITSDSAEALPSDSVRKIPDTVDAHVRVIAEDDDDDDVIVKRPLTPVARLPVPKDAQCYNMNHKNRGKCVIFNNEEFDMDFDKREGSTTDAKRLSATFGRLEFDIEVHDNFSHSEILDTVEKLSKLDHTDNDCICIIVLTHGLQNDLICAKDAAYKSDKIWKPFTGDKCTTLAGKPKLFFFQACRGDEVDGGVVLSPLSIMPSSTDSVITSYKIPTHADFLIAHSSAQNFYTWRNPTEGTWYVQCLCDILDEYGTKLDLLSMLTLTARKVATEYASYNPQDTTKHDKKQVPSATSMLLRYVYFPPKLSA